MLACVVIGLLLLLVAIWPFRTAYGRDVAQRKVSVLEGIIRRIRKHDFLDTSQYTHYHYYYEIQAQRFEVANSAAYDALDERFWYRVYYLPRSHRIVNIEPLGMLGYR